MYYDYYFHDIIASMVVYFMLIFLLFGGLLCIFKIVYSYALFKKMGRKGWEGIIPIYNTIIKLQVLNIPLWMIVFLFVPGINIALSVIITMNMSKKFNKDILFTIGLIFVPIVFYPILAFGKSEFNPDINGMFDNNVMDNSENFYGYCTNCGTRLSGIYCSECGMKKD